MVTIAGRVRMQHGDQVGVVTMSSQVPSLLSLIPRSFLFPRSSLLSLDLSYNRLADLPAVIKVIAELKQLCNLSLKGNPLTVRLYWKMVKYCLFPSHSEGQYLSTTFPIGPLFSPHSPFFPPPFSFLTTPASFLPPFSPPPSSLPQTK